ncbi:MAG TPA: hypothetical protein VHU40_09660 [Polyangia bacterium]|nr:hypothetical protein [Polyangia bacterium]
MSAPLVGCGGEKTTVAEVAPTPVVARQIVHHDRNDVTVFSDGSSEIGPRVTDVAMLKLMPDGTYSRTCGPPDPETRTMMEGLMRSRMGSRR